ncbi:MAG: ankyrin repeat domain-containing protein [bacterium]
MAAERGLIKISDLLISSGADINAKDGEGDTPLRKATLGRHEDVAEHLIAHGAELDIFSAVYLRSEELVRKVIAYGKNINVKDKNDYTPLMRALLLQDNERIIDLLFKSGAAVTVECTETICGYYERNTYVDKYCATPLHLAVTGYISGRFNSPHFVELMIKKGADVNAKMTDGSSAISIAASGHFRTDVVKLLIDAGADVNSKDCRGVTPLHIAVRSSPPPIYYENGTVELLIANGADLGAEINIKDSHNETPLDIAKRQGYKKLVGLLRANGAK